MKYLKIQSKGEIETEALSLMGASTKKEDFNTIGKYGSGGKYSISSLIRNGIDFKIFSGEKNIDIKTEETTFRGQTFSKIIIDGQKTSLTTSMGGSEWDGAFAPIREIYSNALDEDSDSIVEETELVEGRYGYTTYFIELNQGVRDFKENIFNYFCIKNPSVLFSNKHISAYENPMGTLRLFRKGILCKEDQKVKSLFQYNSTEFKINESRVLSDTWDARYTIGSGWKMCSNEASVIQLIEHLRDSNMGTYEHELIWGSGTPFSKAWHDVLKDKTIVGVEFVEMFSDHDLKNAIALPFEIVKKLKNQFNNLNVLGLSVNSESLCIEVKKPSEILQNKVIDAMGFLLQTDYRHRLDKPTIKYVKFSDKDVLGQFKDECILLSTKLDSYSTDEISKIIIEENEHGITGFDDKTRSFQNHLFNIYFEQLKISNKQ